MICQGKSKTTGQACKMQALKGDRYCFTHSPATRKAQAAARKLGGINSSTQHAGDVATIPENINSIADAAPIIRYVLDELLIQDNTIPRAKVLLLCVETFIKAFQIGELEQRLTALEERIK